MSDRPITGVYCALVSKNRILLNKGENKWELPGAFIPEGEQVQVTAKRHIKELTGKDVDIVSIVGLISQHVITGEREKYYLLHLCILKPRTRVNQSARLKWFALDKLDDDSIVHTDYEVIKKMIIEKSGTYYDCVIKDEILTKFESLH